MAAKAKGIRVGDPFVLGLRAPDVIDARRRVMASGEAETVQWSERVPIERLFDVCVAEGHLAKVSEEVYLHVDAEAEMVYFAPGRALDRRSSLVRGGWLRSRAAVGRLLSRCGCNSFTRRRNRDNPSIAVDIHGRVQCSGAAANPL